MSGPHDQGTVFLQRECTTIPSHCEQHTFLIKGTSRGLEALQSNMNDSYYKSVLCWQYSLFQNKLTFNSEFFVDPLGEGGQKFTWLVI